MEMDIENGTEILGIEAVDAILVENPTLEENGFVADGAPPALVEAADNALIVLPAPMNNGEALEVQWLTVQPPPAGPGGTSPGLADHPAALYLARLAPSSRQTMSCVLGGVAQTLSAGRHTLWSLPWHQVRYPQMSALRSHLAAAYAPATANLYMTAVRGVLAECWQLGLLSAEEKARACNLPSIRGERLPAGRAVVVGELRALLRACAEDKDPSARRDAALVGILYGSGLRRAEASALDLSDLDLGAGSLAVRHGKGNKARQVYLASGGAELLEAWLAVRGEEAGPLFVPVLKSGKLADRRPGASVRAVRSAEAGACRRGSRTSRRTTCAARLWGTCWRRGRTSPRCRRWRGMRAYRRRRATTGGASRPRRRRPGCSISRRSNRMRHEKGPRRPNGLSIAFVFGMQLATDNCLLTSHWSLK